MEKIDKKEIIKILSHSYTKVLLSNFSGWKSLIYMSSFDKFNYEFVILLNSLKDGVWLDVKSTISRFNTITEPSLYNLFREDAFRELKIKNSKTKEYVNLVNNHATLSEPYLKATLWLFASLGLLDVAYDKQMDSLDISYYDGIKFYIL